MSGRLRVDRALLKHSDAQHLQADQPRDPVGLGGACWAGHGCGGDGERGNAGDHDPVSSPGQKAGQLKVNYGRSARYS